MNTQFGISLRVAAWLLWTEIQLFLKNWRSNVFDEMCWPFVLIMVNGYVLPAMGMPANYGAFTSISMLIIMASFSCWGSSSELAADLEKERSISYELTLPVPYWLVYQKISLSYALKAAVYSSVSLLVGKLLLGDNFSFAQFSVGHFFLMYLVCNLFFGAFALWAAIYAGSISEHRKLEIRYAGPLFFVCGYASSWLTLYSVAPTLAHLMLATPWIYAYEGTRASILGQAGFINYWISLAMLVLFYFVFTVWGVRLFKKKLDCV